MRKAHKALLISFLIVIAGVAGLLYRFNQGRSAQSNPDDALGVEVSDFNSMLNGLNGQVSQLQALNSGSQSNTGGSAPPTTSNVDYALLAVPTVQGTILQLNAERTALQYMLGQTQGADLTGEFYYRESTTYSIVGGVYANVGLQTARSANVTFTFYSQPSGQGTILCAGTFQLGSVGPGTISTIGSLQCGSGSTSVGSVTFQMAWMPGG